MMNPLPRFARRLTVMSLARWTILAEIARASFGAAGFIAAARALGVSGYGVFSAAVAVAQFTAPLATLGLIYVLPALDGEAALRRQLQGAISSVQIVMLLPLTGAITLVAPVMFPDTGREIIFGVVGAELLFHIPLALSAVQELTLSSRRTYLFAMTYASAARFAAIAAAGGFAGRHDSGSWATVYLAVSGLAWLARILPGVFSWAPRRSVLSANWRRGLAFALTSISTSVFDNADKYIVLIAAGPAAAGLYSAAFKIAQYVLVPIRGIEMHAYPQLFAYARRREWTSLRALVRNTATAGLIAGVSASLFLLPALSFFGSELVPDYRGITFVAVPLCAAFSLRAFHYVYGDLLYALGATRRRVAAIALVSAIYLPALWLIAPLTEAIGASVLSLAAEIGLVIFLWKASRADLGLASRGQNPESRLMSVGEVGSRSNEPFPQ